MVICNGYETPEDAFRLFEEKYQQKRKELKRPTILVAGYTGSGKTSLIQAICGKEVVPDEKISAGLPKTQRFDYYEDDYIRFWDSKGLEPGIDEEAFINDAQGHVRQLQNRDNIDDHIHLVWYTIQGSGARVTPCDLRLIKDIFPNVIVLITKNDITRQNQLEAMTKVLTDNGVASNRIMHCADSDPQSLKKVVDLSYELLPIAYRDAFNNAQVVNLDKKQKFAYSIISSAASAAGLAGAVNLIPMSDAAIITPIQIGMISSLAVLYKEPFAGLKTSFMPLIAKIIGILTANSLFKLLPGLGHVIHGGVAFALTGALGIIVNQYLIKCFKARMLGEKPPKFYFDEGDFRDAFDEWKKKSK